MQIVGEAAPRRKARARKQACRPWTAAEETEVRQHYGKMATVEIARLLGRTCNSIWRRAKRLSVRVRPRMTEQTRAVILALYAKGLSRKEIAERVERDPHTVSECLAELGFQLTAAAISAINRKNIQFARGVCRDSRVAGRLGAQVSQLVVRRAVRQFAAESGWPEDLRLREIQILNALAALGPMTRREIAAAIGASTGLNPLQNNGSYLAALARGGLVFQLHRSSADGHRIDSIYLLTAEALALQEAHTQGGTP